jgi:hypothetical protein
MNAFALWFFLWCEIFITIFTFVKLPSNLDKDNLRGLAILFNKKIGFDERPSTGDLKIQACFLVLKVLYHVITLSFIVQFLGVNYA